MSTGEPIQFLYVIRIDADDPNSLLFAPFEPDELGTFLFNATEHAQGFLAQFADRPNEAVVATVLSSELRAILKAQIERGVKYVTTDPIPNAGKYLKHQTLKIEDYIRQIV
jgi:hypothetical protein